MFAQIKIVVVRIRKDFPRYSSSTQANELPVDQDGNALGSLFFVKARAPRTQTS